MELKKCSKCKCRKSLIEFTVNTKSNKISSWCKSCVNISQYHYRHSKLGLLKLIFHNQVHKSKKRNLSKSTYTLQEFRDMYVNNPDFVYLYNNWVKSDYNKMLAPSFDRERNDLGYSFDNLRHWCTWQENKDRNHIDRRNGLDSLSKSVIGTHKINGNIKEFVSARQAGRLLNITSSSISMCCNGIRMSAGGYFWRYA